MARSYFSQLFLGNGLVGCPFEAGNELVLAPREPKVGIGDELVDAHELLEVDALRSQLDDLPENDENELVELLGEGEFVLLVFDAAEVLELEDRLSGEAVDDVPQVLVEHLLLRGEAVREKQQQIEEAALRCEELDRDWEVFVLKVYEHLL